MYSCKSLVAIRVAQNMLAGQISPKIAELESLSFFSITQNSFTNVTATLRVLAKCKNLTSLFLSSNFYGESLPAHKSFIGSGEFPNVQFFYLENCQFAPGPIPEWLSTLKSLRSLIIDGNKFIGRVPNWIVTLPKLCRLELSNNSLSGEIPTELYQLPALISKKVQTDLKFSLFELPAFVFRGNVNTYLRLKDYDYHRIGLSHNAFTGNIPEAIGNLLSLQELELNNNYFSGNIPVSMSSLKNLELLDLSTNNLSGEIPTSLASISFLSHFNVSYNDLEGPIPTGGQFLTFQQSSFEGNPGLCGDQFVSHPCYSLTASGQTDRSGSDDGGSQRFVDGLFVGFASGLSGILIVMMFYASFNGCKRRQLCS